MPRLFLPFAALLLLSLSGCCEYLGLCASASVHTSIDSPYQYAQQDTQDAVGPNALAMIAQGPSQSSSCPN
jgi:hypothetical protein